MSASEFLAREVAEWLAKAEEDLDGARVLARAEWLLRDQMFGHFEVEVR